MMTVTDYIRIPAKALADAGWREHHVLENATRAEVRREGARVVATIYADGEGMFANVDLASGRWF